MNKPPSLAWRPADHRQLGTAQRSTPFLILGDKYARAARTKLVACWLWLGVGAVGQGRSGGSEFGARPGG